MAKVAWKYIKGYGPYAYLQESVRIGDKVVSKHLKYLGKGVAVGQIVSSKGLKATVPLIPGAEPSLKTSTDIKGLGATSPKKGSQAPVATKVHLDLAELQFLKGHLYKLLAAGTPPKGIAAKIMEKVKEATVLDPSMDQMLAHGAAAAKAAKKAAVEQALADLEAELEEDTGPEVVPAQQDPVEQTSGKVLKTKVMKKAAEAIIAGQPVQLLLKPSEKKLIDGAFSEGGVQAAEKAVAQLSEKSKKLADSSKTPGMGAAVLLKNESLATALAALTGSTPPVDLQAAAQGIQESTGTSHYGDTVREIAEGEQKAPTQSKPSVKALIGQQQQELAKKDWDEDLQEISGQKGSNAGGLYKDKVTQSLYYVKWGSKHDAKGNHLRSEHLANLLYQLAGVPVPATLLIKFGGKTALASEWVKDAEPMTTQQMGAHPTVRKYFVVDAWLANWDVVGLDTDNIVKGPASSKKGEAYRIDPGGSLLFRAQGKLKPFPADDIPELESMRDSITAPQASKVFKGLTDAQLKIGARAVARISDDQIDDVVDLAFPKPVSMTLASGRSVDIGTYLKKAVKGRRDFLIEEVVKAEPPRPLTADELASASTLSEASIQEIVRHMDQFTPHGSVAAKRQVLKRVMENQLGKGNGKAATAALVSLWTGSDGWKGRTTGAPGSVLRWAAAEHRGKGKRAEEMLEFVWKHFGGEKQQFEQLRKKIGADAVKAVAVSRAMNTAYLMSHLNENKTKKKGTVTLYRTDRPDIVKILGFQDAKVGETVTMKEPVLFSWSFQKLSWGLSPGAKRYKAEVPIEEVTVTDRVSNATGSLADEDEVVFCCPIQDAKVIAVG